MIKKKTKTKKAPKKSGKKRCAAKKGKELNPAEVRKDISQLVQSEARNMAAAVIGEGMKGQLAPVKYLFEVASIFPMATDGEQSTSEEDCLAKTLLHRLNLPEEPSVFNEDEPAKAAVPGADAANALNEGEAEVSDLETTAEKKSTDPVLA